MLGSASRKAAKSKHQLQLLEKSLIEILCALRPMTYTGRHGVGVQPSRTGSRSRRTSAQSELLVRSVEPAKRAIPEEHMDGLAAAETDRAEQQRATVERLDRACEWAVLRARAPAKLCLPARLAAPDQLKVAARRDAAAGWCSRTRHRLAQQRARLESLPPSAVAAD